MMRFINYIKFVPISTTFFIVMAVTSCHNAPNNEEIQRSVTDSLQADANTKNVIAKVEDGALTLTGTCYGSDCVEATENKVKQINGVKSVLNKVSMTPQDADLTLRTQVQNITTKYAGVQSDVSNGVVVLRGSIDRNLLQPLMTELKTVQASKIDNQLAIK